MDIHINAKAFELVIVKSLRLFPITFPWFYFQIKIIKIYVKNWSGIHCLSNDYCKLNSQQDLRHRWKLSISGYYSVCSTITYFQNINFPKTITIWNYITIVLIAERTSKRPFLDFQKKWIRNTLICTQTWNMLQIYLQNRCIIHLS